MTSLPLNKSACSSAATNSNTQTRSSNENILVGDDPCSYEKVCEVLSKCKSEILWSSLIDIARSLDLPVEFIATIKKNLNVDFQTPRSVLYDTLENWRAKHTDNATLINFIKVLGSHKLYDCGDALRTHFNVANRQLEATQQPIQQFSSEALRALNFKIRFQGSVMQLHEILQGLSIDDVQELIEKYLWQPKRPELLINDSLPKPLSYYVTRRLTTRCTLEPALFTFECKDVFVIRYIELHELAIFAKNQDIDLSTNQLDTLSVRFIVLEYKQDFDRICEISSAPVHLIDHEIGQFTWVRSHGNIINLKNHLHTAQQNLDEDEFTSECLKSSKTICIADTPGMGKTVLLISIAHKILRAQRHTLVRYIVLRDFIQKVKNRSEATNSAFLINLIANEACETEFGCEIIKLLFQAQQQTVHLMFDGYDEVLESQVDITNLVLETISLLKSVKLYVSTRPHLKDELENTLAVLGYTIQAFGEKEQLDFLTKFWGQFGKRTIDSKLHEFAIKCIAKLQKTMNDFEREIAGIPLQCQLLAEVYKNEAIKYTSPESNVHGKDNEINVQITSFFEMYRQLMELRLRKVQMPKNIGLWRKIRGWSLEDQTKFINKAHEYAALRLLFPDYVSQFKRFLIKSKQFKTRKLCAIGLLEESESRTGFVCFAHRTFAEYFLGMFVARMIIKHFGIGYEDHEFSKYVFTNFLLNTIFRTTTSWTSLLRDSKAGRCKILESSSFQYPVICYFVNGHIRSSEPQCISNMSWTTDVNQLYNVVFACVNHDYHELCKLVLQPQTHRKLIQDRFEVAELVFFAAKCTNIDHFKTIYHYVLKSLGSKIHQSLVIKSSSPEFKFTPLHTAVERGHFAIFNFLRNSALNQTARCTESWTVKYILHCCVAGSVNDDKITLSQKAGIIILLSKTNRETINERLSDGTTPLLSFNVHVELVKTLLDCGADFRAKNVFGESVFHVCAKNGNHAALTYLLQLPGVSNTQITAEDSNGYTPFLHGMMFGDGLTLEIIMMMEEKGLVITPSLASDALKFPFCNKGVMPPDLNLNFVQTVDYLNSKGGILQDENGKSPWEMESLKWNLRRLADATKCDEMFLCELQKREISTHKDKALYLGNSSKLYKSLRRSRENKSFEAVCASLIACNQIQPFMMLKQCLNNAASKTTKFVTLPNGLVDFIESKHRRVVILRSLNLELSVLRLQNTIDPHITIITDEELTKNVSVSKILICKCKTATKSLVVQLAALQAKIICLCTYVDACLQDGIVLQLQDDIEWSDLSVKFQKELIPQMKIKIHKNYATFSKSKYCFRTWGNRGTEFRLCNLNEITKDFSNLKNELLIIFIQGSQPELTEFNLISNPLVGSCKIILESDCKLSVDNLRLKLYLRQQSSDEELEYYCPVTALPYLLQEQWTNNPLAVEIFALTKLVKVASAVGRYVDCSELMMSKSEVTTRMSDLQEVINIVHKCVEHLNFTEIDWRKLTEIAINTVFPGLIKRREISGMDGFSAIGIVQECNGSFTIMCKTLALYLVAKLVLRDDNCDLEYMSLVRGKVFMQFSTNMVVMRSVYVTCVVFKDEKLISIIEFLLSKQSNVEGLKKHLENMIGELPRLIYACIIGNLFRLMKVILSVGVSSNYFHEKMLVIFAVRFGSNDIVKLVIDKFVTETGKRVQDISCTLEELEEHTYINGIKFWVNNFKSNVDIKEVALLRDDKSLIAMINEN
ncbi:unnamed protein product [Orchesella dallaii]|uniref:NACHT domain-containing protein n=1 Tax=Orchesella dallaii TaxID=48710 RepID=A0ABP1RY73_9HEXA